MPLRPKAIVARRLRRDATDVENLLWRRLRESDTPWKFRRQHPIGRHIADFACPARKLVGRTRWWSACRADADDARSAVLAARGYHVIRFWNNDVIENIEGVVATILRTLEQPPPHPNPLRPRGRRGS